MPLQLPTRDAPELTRELAAATGGRLPEAGQLGGAGGVDGVEGQLFGLRASADGPFARN